MHGHDEEERMVRRSPAVGLVCSLASFALALMPAQAVAADVKLLAGTSMRVVLPELLPQFEQSSGHKVTVEYGTLGAIADRVLKGEAADVAIVTGPQNEKLQNEGRMLAGSRAALVRAGYSLLLKSGAAKPDLSTVDGFKRSLLSAKSIALGDPAGGGPLGIFSAGLLERLGVTEEVKQAGAIRHSGGGSRIEGRE
jgi:molybdate transport system substrate-binding protein